jgi:hypothetical protein
LYVLQNSTLKSTPGEIYLLNPTKMYAPQTKSMQVEICFETEK